MEGKKKIIIGYDLCEDFSQISCYSYKTFEPIPISQDENEEYEMIPTVLCLHRERIQWLYGSEALAASEAGEGILVDHLLSKLKNKEVIEIYGQRMTGITLMEKFLRRTLTLVKRYFPGQAITSLVITLEDMDPVIVDGIYTALAMLGIDRDRASIISHGDSYLHYALNQDKSLWLNDVGLFDFTAEGLSYYQISINRRARPMIAMLKKKDFSDTINYELVKQKPTKIGYVFENIANTVLYKQIISTLYFTGKGFEGSWTEDTIKRLCIGRRGFLGQSLYTKGACYAAKEFSGDENLNEFILLNEDMILTTIQVRVYSDAKTKELTLTEAARPWFEVNESIEVIPDHENQMEMILTNVISREVIRQRFPVEHLPERPNRMTRLKINVTCLRRDLAKITITDLGFGDLYPGVGVIGEYRMELE